MTEGKIVSWTKSPGDKVAKGETVLVVESDKADMDVESFYEGYLATILVEAGQEAPVGAAIAYIAETEAEIAEAKAKAGSSSAPTPAVAQPVASAPEPAPVAVAVETSAPVSSNGKNGQGRLIASPRAKKLAKELGVTLTSLQGTGPNGRIVAEDVERAAGKTPASTPGVLPTVPATVPAVAVAPRPSATPPAAPTVTPGQTVPLTTFQKALVQNMVAAMAAPVFRVGYTITTDGLDALYKQIKSKGVTMTALLAKAVAVTLKKHPIVNASYTDQGIVYHRSVNIAMAVAMPDGGLITPVLQGADQVDIYSLSRQWKELVERARVKQLQPEEYNSGTFTLSNLGMLAWIDLMRFYPPAKAGFWRSGLLVPRSSPMTRG